MQLSERIKHLRTEKGLSQERLSEAVGVSRQAVAKWESGVSAPSTENLFRLAEVFGTSVDLILPKGTAASPEKTKGRRGRKTALLTVLSLLLALAISFCLWLHLRPVSFDAAACSGGYATWIFDKYSDELTEKFYTCSDQKELISNITAVRGSHEASWDGRLIFLSFDVTYLHETEGEVTLRLSFTGERIWTDTFRWGGAVMVG